MDNGTEVLRIDYLSECPDFVPGYFICRNVCDIKNGSEYNCSVNADVLQDKIYKEKLSIEKVMRYTVPSIFGIFFILGVTGNIMVLKVLISNKHMQNTTNLLLGNLALTDLLFVLLCIPFTAANYVFEIWVFGRVWCKLLQYITHVTAFGSSWTLVLISYSRYRAIIHPIENLKMRNKRNTFIALGVMWMVILSINTPLFFMYDVVEYLYFIKVRNTCFSVNDEINKAFTTSFFLIGLAIPLTLICPLYGLILRKLICKAEPGDYQSTKSIQSKLRVSRMLCVIVIVFAICWLPIDLILLVQSFVHFEITPATFGIIFTANCFAYFNSCINPILYGFLSQNFRRSYRNLFCRKSSSSKVRYEMTRYRSVFHDRNNSTPASTRSDRISTLT